MSKSRFKANYKGLERNPKKSLFFVRVTRLIRDGERESSVLTDFVSTFIVSIYPVVYVCNENGTTGLRKNENPR